MITITTHDDETLREEAFRETARQISVSVDRLGLHEGELYIVTDTNVDQTVLPKLTPYCPTLSAARRIVVPAGEEHKNLTILSGIWQTLSETGATRHSAILNIGGGVVTDMGGFAAATFKRGLRCVNVPTTLLGAVDAATGGKTGIDFGGYKNEIGAFAMPADVVISAVTFETLPYKELLSGYGEMLKTALIADGALYRTLRDGATLLERPMQLQDSVEACVAIKRKITEEDPFEKGIRKALNFGHTAGHAFESLCLRRGTPIPHGVAVAHGIKTALILSHMLTGLDSGIVTQYASLLRELFPCLPIRCSDMETLLDLMGHDKKNLRAGSINFTLLSAVGEPVIDCMPTRREIREALELTPE